MYRLRNPVSMATLVDKFGGHVVSDSRAKQIYRLATLEGGNADDIGFVAQPKYLKAAQSSACGALIVAAADVALLPSGQAVLWVVENPYATYAKVSNFFAMLASPDAAASVHPSAVVSTSAIVDPSASIGPNVVVEAGAKVAANVRLVANVFVGRDAVIGNDTVLHPGVVIYAQCKVGSRNVIHSGTVIGSDGFGFAKERGQWVKIAQLGAVVIGDDVEIGSNCSIDRGAIDNTVIGNGVKIDNLVQIAHNVQIGDGTAIAGCVGIAGSAIIGKNCSFGGSAGVLGHLEICDNVTVSSMSLVTRTIKQPGFYSGVFPLQDNADWERVAVSLKQLPQLRQRLRELERLSKKDDDRK
jgi:UDP-3-O-[3-hydroxymyristoyl] glucosamine N-acyltransferase